MHIKGISRSLEASTVLVWLAGRSLLSTSFILSSIISSATFMGTPYFRRIPACIPITSYNPAMALPSG